MVDQPPQLDRREVMKWMASATAAVTALDLRIFGPGGLAPAVASSSRGASPPAEGYGTDPELNKLYQPGAFWPLTFDDAQRRTVAALCDVIIPADDRSPAASTVGVPAFIDEWVSAPYPAQQADRPVVLEGLVWLEAESRKRFDAGFASLDHAPQRVICDDICYLPKAAPEFEQAATFFAKFRNLTAGAFYATRPGMADVGYVGNVPATEFEGPPPEVRAKLGL